MKLTVEQQANLISDEDIKQCFMKRLDIMALPLHEQEKRWSIHLAQLNAFREKLSTLNTSVTLP